MSDQVKLDLKYEYLIAMLMAMGLDGKAFERSDILEFMPKQYASAIRDRLVVIRTPSSTPVPDESYGERTVRQNFVTLKKSRVRMHYEFQIDFWLKDLASEIIKATLSDQAEAHVGLNDRIKNSEGESVEVEFLGGDIVEDENDDFYKVVIRLKFIENKYKSEHVPLLPAADQIDIGVTT